MTSNFSRSPRMTGKKIQRPKKSLGQNFLVDPHVVGRIIDACQLSKEETVLEIGPGTGALTREIASRVNHLVAVETDKGLVGPLQTEFNLSQVQIIHADILKVDLTPFANEYKWKVIGNLPYYISTPIIARILEQRHLFSEFYLTVQQEFAERVVAIPGNKDYGSFSCFVQYYADAQMLFKIKRTSFKPAPKVDSCFLKLTMRPQPLWPARNESFLFQMIRLGFQQRRKTLVNALSTLMPKAELQTVFNQAGIGLDARAEVLGLERFVALSHLLLERHKK